MGMADYKYTGDVERVLTGVVTDEGTLVCRPGDVVSLPKDPKHSLLTPVKAPAAKKAAAPAPPTAKADNSKDDV